MNAYTYELNNFLTENAYGMAGNILNESAQINLTDAVLTKMFELTIGKYNKIDFSSIERSRGDVTKTKFYKNLNECIDTLIDIHSTTNKIPGIVIVSEALNNMLTLKNTFEYNFRIKNNVAIMIYNSIYYAIMEATSYIIAVSIDVSKEDPAYKVYELDNKNMCLINSLEAFNKCVADGSLLKFMKEASDKSTLNESIADIAVDIAYNKIGSFITNHNVKKAAIGAGIIISLLYVGSKIIPIIREIVYWIFKARQKISDAAKIQAEFLELNIQELKNVDGNAPIGKSFGRTITADTIIKKQTSRMKMFNAIAKKFALDSDIASRDQKIDLKQDKVDVSDIVI